MDKQIFAKVGVLVLLSVNVAAYYFLWPHKDGASKTEAPVSAQEPGETKLLPAKKDDKPAPPAPPTEAPKGVWREAKPLEIPQPPEKAEEKNNDRDKIYKLLARINNETDAPKPATEKKATPRAEKKPDSLPPLPDYLRADAPKANAAAPSASATITKAEPGPWLVNMETIGEQTQLIAKLRQRSAVEFKILCDRVEMKAPSGAVQALGKVSFAGAGIKGTCQRLIIPLHVTQLVFEGEAHILHDLNPGNSLRGERILWDSSAPPADTQPVAVPAEVRPSEGVSPAPFDLGLPKKIQ